MDGMINYGILQPNVGNALAAGYQQADERRNALMQQQQQRQLGDIQLQNALREQRMAGEEESAYKAAGSDMNRLQLELMSRGLGKQSLVVGAQVAKQQADKMAMLEQQHKLIKSAASQVFANPESAEQILTSFGQRTGIDMSDDLAQIQSFGGDINKRKQWALGIAAEVDKLIPQLSTKDLGGQVQDRFYNPATGEITVAGTTAKTPTWSEVESNKVARGNLALARQGLALRQQETLPSVIEARAAATARGTAAGQGAGKPVFKDGQWIVAPADMKPGETREVVNLSAPKDAREAINLIDQATKLIPKATGSYFGNLMDTVAQAVGVATGGAQATAQLQALEGILVSKMPKMSGPQSDKDVALYRQMAGKIGDPNIPTSTKQAALKTIKEIQQRYAGSGAPAGGVDASNPWLK